MSSDGVSRDRRRAGVALALVLPALLAGGCGPETARPAAAEVAPGGPDCLADEILWGLGLVPPGAPRPGPAPGAVPLGFEPVAVVECRGPLSGPVEVLPEPLPFATVPVVPAVPAERLSDVDLAVPSPAPAPAPVTVTEVRLEGDLGPLLAALARPSELPWPGQACPAMWESRPEIHLVDAGGRAVRAAWPTTGCGFLLDGVTRPLDALEVVRETTRTTETR
jgi:hypothetical protein